MDPLMGRLVEAYRVKDFGEIARVIGEVVDERDTVVLKCRACGEPVAFERTRALLLSGLSGGSPALSYAALCHMAACPQHDVGLEVVGRWVPFSRPLEERLKAHCLRGGVDYDRWLPDYAERMRLKAVGGDVAAFDAAHPLPLRA